MNKLISLLKQTRPHTIKKIIQGYALGSYIAINKTHNSTASTQTTQQNAGRFLAALLAIEENKDDWVGVLKATVRQVVKLPAMTDKDIETKNQALASVNETLCEKIGYTVSSDVDAQLPVFVLSILSDLPAIVLGRYHNVCQINETSHFLMNALGAGDVCIQGMFQTITTYEPFSFNHTDPIPDSVTTLADKLGYLQSQYDINCISAFRKWYASLEEKRSSDTDILQSENYQNSPYHHSKLSYQRGLLQFLKQGQCSVTDEELKGFFQGTFTLQPDELTAVFCTAESRIQEDYSNRTLAIRLESKARSDDNLEQDMAGMDRTFVKINTKVPIPAVAVGSGYPVNTYIRRLMSAGLIFHYISFFAASKKDFSSDRILQILDHKDYKDCETLEQKVAYIETALNLTPHSLITDFNEWQDKVAELSVKSKFPQHYQSSKHSLSRLELGTDELVSLSDKKIDDLINTYTTDTDFSLRNALRKLKKLSQSDRAVYVSKIQPLTQIDPTQDLDDTGDTALQPVVHNEVLITPDTISDVRGIYLDLSIPGSFSQAHTLQSIVQEINGGERLPFTIYSAEYTGVHTISETELKAIEAFLEGITSNAGSVEMRLENLIHETPSLLRMKNIIQSSATKFLFKYYISHFEFDNLRVLLDSHCFSTNGIIQTELIHILEGVLYQKGMPDSLGTHADKLIPLFRVIFEGSSETNKEYAARAISMMKNNTAAIKFFSQYDAFIQYVFTLIASGSDLQKECAIRIISDIANDIANDIEKRIAKYDAGEKILAKGDSLIQSLSTFMASGSDYQKSLAVWCINCIGRHLIGGKLCANDSLIQNLSTLIASGSDYQKNLAAKGISMLSPMGVVARICVENTGLSQNLINLLASGSDYQKDLALAAISYITYYIEDREHREIYTKNDSLIHTLKQLQSSSSDYRKERASDAIQHLGLS